MNELGKGRSCRLVPASSSFSWKWQMTWVGPALMKTDFSAPPGFKMEPVRGVLRSFVPVVQTFASLCFPFL